jgi:hypothetical protein
LSGQKEEDQMEGGKMNREIKFRVWDQHKKCFVNVSDFQFRKDGTVDYFGHKITFQQFTGLLDKNGKEIYEGDILIYEYTQADMSSFSALESPFETCAIEEVVFKDGAFRFKDNKYSTVADDCKEMEVIGNVFENKELLNK